jgi:hypothetical protein
MTSDDIRLNATLQSEAVIPDRISAFLTAVYAWMCAGLALTAATAWFVTRSPGRQSKTGRSGEERTPASGPLLSRR